MLAVATLGYPFLVVGALSYGLGEWLAMVMLALLLLRSWLQPQQRLISLAGMLLIGAYAITRNEVLLHWYPVLINATMLLLFALSLRQQQSMIECLARLRQPTLPVAARPYLRRVTQVWCGFFVINGSIAATTVLLANQQLWLWYNGFIAYLLMALLLLAEWLIRPKSEPANDH